MRSFLTRLVNSDSRVVLPAPCLLLLILVCSACVTPFPLDNLRVDMTMEQATEAFGEPSSTSMEELLEAVELLRNESARIFEGLESDVGRSETLGPVSRKLEESSTQTLGRLVGFVAELDEARGGEGVVSTWVYPHEEVAWGRVVVFSLVPSWQVFFLVGIHIDSLEVDLRFEGDKLVSWETRPAPSVATTGTYGYQDPFPWMTFPTKDEVHHDAGHKHHHGH